MRLEHHLVGGYVRYISPHIIIIIIKLYDINNGEGASLHCQCHGNSLSHLHQVCSDLYWSNNIIQPSDCHVFNNIK